MPEAPSCLQIAMSSSLSFSALVVAREAWAGSPESRGELSPWPLAGSAEVAGLASSSVTGLGAAFPELLEELFEEAPSPVTSLEYRFP